MTSLLDQLASEQVLTQAYRWLCQTRAHYHHNDDVWHVRYWWATHKPRLQAQMRAGTYRLSECRVVQGRERRSEIWCAVDALMLKALAIVLTEHLQPHLSTRCFHLAGTCGPCLGRQWSSAWHGAASEPTSSSFCRVLGLQFEPDQLQIRYTMETLRLKSHIAPDGHLRLDIPTNMTSGEVELVVVIQTLIQNTVHRDQYDFSDLAGRLQWPGNPVETQRQLRDEW